MVEQTAESFSQRMARARLKRPGRYAHLFDGRPAVVIATTRLRPDQAINVATAYGYRHLETRGSKVVRRRVFVPDPDPGAQAEAFPPGTPFEVAVHHPAFRGESARGARNYAEMIKNERNFYKLVPAAVVLLFAVAGAVVQCVRTGTASAYGLCLFAVALEVSSVLIIRYQIRTRNALLARAEELVRQYPPSGFPGRGPLPGG